MYERLRRALGLACGMFVMVGLTLAFAGGAVFGIWREAVAQSMWGTAFPAELAPYADFTDGILGASIAGKWVACAWLVHEPLRRRERWGLVALLAAHLTWFAIDATASVLSDAAVNIGLIDAMPLVLVTGLALAMWPSTVATERERASSTSARALLGVCVMSIGAGVASAFAIRSPLFHFYDLATAEVFFDGAAGDWVEWQRFVYGLIGATIAGQFVALAVMLWRAPGQRWVPWAVASSMTVWFVVDSGLSLVHGAGFNVLQINLPSYVVTMIPCGWMLGLAKRAPERRAR